ncbi:ead/Ea22-like family protein [Serratia liquefaciens]|uniref:ead/Ea22-like family protein n=1 Tax=Serratia liquefaciens TaxID=614 RepID=UPI0021C6ED2C|nr:ead/Ea22-like family protein [Serratia liquefaciens]
MDKFSELKAAAMAATPGPWFRSSVQFNGITTEATFITQGNKPHVASTSEKRDAIFIAAANPDTVIALLAELEAKDKRIAELETLLERNKMRVEKLGELLATPVRLPEREFDDGSDKQVCILAGRFNSGIDKSAKAIRAAGFKCVGDE